MSELTYTIDIGLWTINRPKNTCVHATRFCMKHCYNNKLYSMFGHVMRQKDIKNEIYWRDLTGQKLKKELSKKRDVKRIRLMARGEAFSTFSDIKKVENLLKYNPSVKFWIPTRAWHKPKFYNEIIRLNNTYKNSRIMASVDLSNNLWPIGISTMYFGDNKEINGQIMCKKTWNDKKKHCAKCRKGCFQKNIVHVHLKKH